MFTDRRETPPLPCHHIPGAPSFERSVLEGWDTTKATGPALKVLNRPPHQLVSLVFRELAPIAFDEQ